MNDGTGALPPDYHKTTATYRPGALTMAREYYTSPEILERELERFHGRLWNCVGRRSALANPGDYIVRDVAGESVIVLLDHDGTLRAFLNICRHRGTRICKTDCGHFEQSIQCSYHAWTYATDGRLIGAPHMHEAEGFDKSDYPLHGARVAEWEGFLFVNLNPDAASFETAWQPLHGRFKRFALPDLVVGHRVVYDVPANWKLVFQNYNECLHCPTIHPKLASVLPYQSGANDLTEGPFLGGAMEIKAPNRSATMSGKPCGRLLGPMLSETDRQHAFYYSLMPNMLLSLHPDYVNYYTVRPLAVDRTEVLSEWLFHPATVADPENNIADAVAFWDLTNRQDWEIVAESQIGIGSRHYRPGPYSPRESVPAAWDRAYRELMAE